MRIIQLQGLAEAIVSDKDYKWLRLLSRWSLSIQGYAYSGHGSMHRMVAEHRMGLDLTELVVHHVNGNKLDNRRGNLEAITHRENIRKGFEAKRARS